jgi:hypothetical protein
MGERGQGSVEYVALVAVVALLLGGGAAVVARLAPGPPTRAEADRALALRHAPALVFERGISDAPVDPRACRAVACARGARPVLFTHVLRRGPVTYVHYWAYWPDSSWHGVAGRHADDWESLQLRINADGTIDARASAHHGYTGPRIGPDLNLNQVRPALVPRPWRGGWTRWRGGWRIARHSHAGFVTTAGGTRDIILVPLDPATLPQDYAVTPPWRKAVYSDPESPAT